MSCAKGRVIYFQHFFKISQRNCLQTVFKTWRLHHCHKTGKFLGYVCHRCNEGFGAFDDNPEQMQRALDWQRERLENV